jgi:hypothetical protein
MKFIIEVKLNPEDQTEMVDMHEILGIAIRRGMKSYNKEYGIDEKWHATFVVTAVNEDASYEEFSDDDRRRLENI